jgi:hypothetical protein
MRSASIRGQIYLVAGQRVALELIDVGEGGARRLRMPGEIEQGRGEILRGGEALIEGSGLPDAMSRPAVYGAIVTMSNAAAAQLRAAGAP